MVIATLSFGMCIMLILALRYGVAGLTLSVEKLLNAESETKQ
jgi:hypothetical protein